MKSARPIIAASLFGSLCLSASAQKPATPSLNDILMRLQANLDHYDQRVPGFFCDEHVTSGVDSDSGKHETTIDATFRLKRVEEDNGTLRLDESRDIKSVNGKPSPAHIGDLKLPSTLEGVFEGGLAVVSAKQVGCMKYTLERPSHRQAANTYTIRFNTNPPSENTEDCLLREASKGTAVLDATTLQIKRLEITTPHHTIIPGNAYNKPVIGKRTLVVDYSPIQLGGEILWMPQTVAMTAAADTETFHPTFWTFHAEYRNYHRLEVTSHMHHVDGKPLQ